MTEHRTIYPALGALVARYRLVLGAPFAAAVLTAVVVMIIRPTFVSTTSFVPENRSTSQLPAGILGAAAQLGFNFNTQGSRSPAFYADVIRGRAILTQILATRVSALPGTADSATVADLYRIGGATPEIRLEDGIRLLRRRIGAEVDPRTDVVHVSVEASSAHLAHDVAAQLIDRLADFNLSVRQSTGRYRREFVEGRVTEAVTELRNAEDQLRSFLERNRSWQSSPQLTFEQQRLNRQLTLQQDLYLNLRREYETARIEEINNTPVVTVIDQPSIPGRRARPQRVLTVLIVAIVVGLLSCILALLLEYARSLREAGDPEYLHFRERITDIGQRLQRRRSARSS